MYTTRNLSVQFSGDKTQIFLLQDSKGFHVILRILPTKKADIKEKTEEDNSSKRTVTLDNTPPGLTPKAKGIHRGNVYGTNNKQTSKAVVTLKSKSPSLSAARSINYYFLTGLLHISEKNVLSILEIALRLGLTVVQEACMVLLSKSLTVGSWDEVLRLSQDYHNRTLKNAFTQFTRQHISKCFTRKDVITLAGALTHSNVDRQSLKCLLKRCQTSRSSRNMVKVLFELMNSEAKMLEGCFKEYLQNDDNILAIEGIDESDDTQTVQQARSIEESQAQNRHDANALLPNESPKAASNTFCLQSIISPSKHQIKMIITNEQKSETDGASLNDAHLLKESSKTVRKTTTIKPINSPSLPRRTFIRSGVNTDEKQAKIDDVSLGLDILPMYSLKNLEKTSHPQSTTAPGLLLISGGILNEQNPQPTNLVFMYKQTNDQWFRMPSMSHQRYNHSIVTIDDTVIAIGGSTACRDNTVIDAKRDISVSDTMYRNKLLNPTQTNTVEQFSMKGDEWREARSMILSREEHCTVVVGDQVYTIGGHDGICQLCSVERYNTTNKKWSLEKPMSRLRTGASAVTDGRYIYIIGGYDGLKWLNTIECYDTLDQAWLREQFPPMAERRGYAGAELLHSDIYVFGGTNDYDNLKTCEVFNVKIKEWRRGPPMNEPRLNAGHCVLDGRVLVLGGESNGEFLDTIEQLDIVEWKWEPFNKMPVKVAGLQCTVVAAN